MKKSLSCVLLASAFMLCLFAQSVMWETLIPFESDDDGPVGIDITDAGEILVAYYTNGPNESIWVEDSLIHSPVTKVARLDASGDLINTEDLGQLFNHDVTGIGRTENGYSLSGNYLSPVTYDNYWYYLSNAKLINFNGTARDSVEYKQDYYSEYKAQRIKTSNRYEPKVEVLKGSCQPGATGGTSKDFVINLKDSLIMYSDYISIPDTIDFDKGSFYVNDIDVSDENHIILTGLMINPEGYDDYLVYLISMDSERNVLWENYHFVYSDVYRYYHSVSYSPEGGCIAGAYSDANYLMKYNSAGTFEYSIGPYLSSSYKYRIEWIYSIGNNEYLFKIEDSDIIYKIIDTGTGLIEDWSLVLEGIKAVRAVENGFVAAGVKDGNIWMKGFDATTGIEDISSIPSVTTLYQNYPNPFNPVTQIKFALAKTADVKLSVYNISGQLVSQLASGVMNAGVHAVDFDGSKLNSGIYYYTLEVDGKAMTKRMVLVK